MSARGLGVLLAGWLGLALAAHAAASGESLRGRVAEQGVVFGGDVAGELIRAEAEGEWLANLEGSAWMEADLGALLGLDHWYAFVNPSLAYGDEENGRWRGRLYQAWLAWDGSERFNVLAGVVDPSWHFHSLPSAAPFSRLPTRSSGDFSPGSLGLLDVYPLSAPAIRAEWKPFGSAYVQASATWLDTDHEIHGRPLLAGASASERWLALGEVGWRNDGDGLGARHRAFGVGAWSLPSQSDSWGAYVFLDIGVWREPEATGEGLSAFVSLSAATASGFEREDRVVLGLSYLGLLPGRERDVTALAYVGERGGAASDGSEPAPRRHAWEILHRLQLLDGLWLQASLQHQDRAGEAGPADWRAGLRLGAEF